MRVRVLVARLALATAAAAVVAAPLSLGWAVTQSEVHQVVGVTPTTLSLTTAGHSELRLGVAGTVYVPRSRGPLGVVARVDGPGEPTGAHGGDLASYVQPGMLRLYAGLFHDPAPAVDEYLDLLVREVVRQLALAEVTLSLVGGVALVAVRQLRPVPRPGPGRARLRAGAALLVALLASGVVSSLVLRPRDDGAAGPQRYDLPALDGGPASGSTTDSPVIRLLLGAAVPKVRELVRRQEDELRAFQHTAAQALERQAAAMEGPRGGETAVMMQSDMHCNATMVALQRRVVSMLALLHGSDAVAGMAVTGDLTTNGTAAEGDCIRAERAVVGDRPVAAVTGNHESAISARQMADAGMQVLDDSRGQVGGLSVLGAADPRRTELFGPTTLRGRLSEPGAGRRLRASADRTRVDMVLVHEGYAAAAFLGTRDMTRFLQGRGDPASPARDDVAGVPAGAVFYGHWHRSIEPRVVWSADGSWTLVMELDTSGGAVGAPTLDHFSTPWSRPQQEASFPVVFWDRSAGLVTGYQVYRFRTDGSVVVEPRVDVGNPTSPLLGRRPR